MPRTYVALDLETTGLNVDHDEIIEIGAVRFQGPQELESFSTFVNPGRPIPSFITDLTGIRDVDVAHAPTIHRVLDKIREFVGRDLVVGHNINFDLNFLRRHGVLRHNAGIDTFELANILVPHARRYSLSTLCEELRLDVPDQTHRALDDARMAHLLYVTLFRRAQQLPRELLQELVRLGEHVNWGARYFFKNALYQRRQHSFQGGLGSQLAAQLGKQAGTPLFLPEVEFDPLEPRPRPLPLDVEALSALLAPGGPLEKIYAQYEYRPQQREMLEAVACAFNEERHLMVEAGTGTGKSLAYLIPAVRWADQNDDRVVISTNTINLQEQLVDKDIPLLQQLFPTEFRTMILKGRSHYLCRRQLERLRREGPSSKEEMRVLARILLWLPHTLDGDGDDLFLPTPKDRAIWSRLSASMENCNPSDCPFYRGDGCFFYRARERAETAHVLIVNHALLLADVVSENRVLPSYEHLIIDEAHHLEHATTESLHFSVNWYALRYTLNELVPGHSKHAGLIEELQALSHHLSRERRQRLMTFLSQLEEMVEQTERRLQDLFDNLGFFMDEHLRNRNPMYSNRLRIDAHLRKQPDWDAIEIIWDGVVRPFERLVEKTNRLVRDLEDVDVAEVPTLDVPRARLIAVSRRLEETYHHLHALIAEPVENAIYWLEEGRNEGPLSLHMVPLQVGRLVREHLFDKKKSVVLTSATLRVGGTFDYLRQRLEAWDAEELAVGSPFDYASAALFYVVNDSPAPGQHGYQKTVEETLIDLFRATEGRALVLFTSYSQLRSTAQAITKPLARQKINVYAQGKGNSRAQLLENFRSDERAVLLGTRSFWEGVDIPGEALSCLVIAKLPFDVPSDPIVQARSEVCGNPFNDYMVPEAVLRFLQGFGRLIRTRTDRGVVAVLDGRLLTKRYGQRFLDSLPGPTVRTGSRHQLPEVAARWLAGDPLPPEVNPTTDEAWSVPPPEEPPWAW
ncbi:MAG: helicase C-terminal domain-containing protein [Anaerolineae bacterium]